jgi:uracil-DNA glycosylase
VTEKANIEKSWKKHLEPTFKKPFMTDLRAFLTGEIKKGRTIYPRTTDYFRAFDSTPIDEVRVVILGQDPYHGPGQAHGLSFSVPEGVKPPPSLVNVYKELVSDLGIDRPQTGNLQKWADQGVLLLNSVLTVESRKAASHRGRGWERFTDDVIEILSLQRQNLVFMLWGSYAQKKGAAIDRERHLVLEAPHPSPLSAHRGFLGCSHFSKANDYLVSNGSPAIDWSLN